MEPVTHLLTGACLGRAGFNRTTAYATLAMTLAAEAPDLDMFWFIRGPVAEFQHHRGFTHTFIGAPFMALFITGVVWLWHRWRIRKSRADTGPPGQLAGPPVRWGWIWLCALIADLSHILLDWTNNYGVRPFYPFNPRWYAGNIFFIFEPVFFAFLLAALLLPWLLGLADREIGVRSELFRGRGWAILALAASVALGGWRWVEHDRALGLLAQQDYQGQTPIKMTVSPYPGNVFHWFGVVETRDFYETAELNTRSGSFSSQAPDDLYWKPSSTPAIQAARRSWLGRVFLDWSKFPYVEESPVPSLIGAGARATKVRFEDLRFAYNVLFLHGRRRSPLGGSVIVGSDGQIEQMRMNGHVQKMGN